MLYADFSFDCAGQGLFYHGKIYCENQSFSVVYDCGTSNQIKGAKKNLSKLVNRYHEHEGQLHSHIGLLAISHFDFDHVSHIPELLRGCSVDTVMLPHISDELRVVFLAKCMFEASGRNNSEFMEQQDWGEDIVELFRNPVSYFVERGAEQIIGILGDNDDNSFDDTPYEEKPIRPFQPSDNDYEGSEQLYLQYVGGGQWVEPEEKQLEQYVIYRGSPAYRLEIKRYSWLFRPLNVQEKLPSAFYNDVRDTLYQCNNDWWELLSDASKIKQLTKIYDLYIGRSRRNAHSLLLRHKPEQHGRLTSGGYKNPKHSCIQCMKCLDNNKNRGCCDNSATVLLGDIELDGKARAVLDKYKFLGYEVGIALIPHHGANSDDLMWLDKKMMHNGCCTNLVVSYGTKNRYMNRNGHPHPRFIYDGTMAKLRTSIAFVNEENDYRYGVFLHD
jgi:hypothetical protein